MTDEKFKWLWEKYHQMAGGWSEGNDPDRAEYEAELLRRGLTSVPTRPRNQTGSEYAASQAAEKLAAIKKYWNVSGYNRNWMKTYEKAWNDWARLTGGQGGRPDYLSLTPGELELQLRDWSRSARPESPTTVTNDPTGITPVGPEIYRREFTERATPGDNRWLRGGMPGLPGTYTGDPNYQRGGLTGGVSPFPGSGFRPPPGGPGQQFTGGVQEVSGLPRTYQDDPNSRPDPFGYRNARPTAPARRMPLFAQVRGRQW